MCVGSMGVNLTRTLVIVLFYSGVSHLTEAYVGNGVGVYITKATEGDRNKTGI